MQYSDETFTDETVKISGNSFQDCTFTRCHLVFDGNQAGFSRCHFDDPQFVFEGLAANSISFLSRLYQAGGSEMVEKIFQQIRSGYLPDNQPPEWPDIIDSK
jgi:hypothetical protein